LTILASLLVNTGNQIISTAFFQCTVPLLFLYELYQVFADLLPHYSGPTTRGSYLSCSPHRTPSGRSILAARINSIAALISPTKPFTTVFVFADYLIAGDCFKD